MKIYPEILNLLIEYLKKLPGIGEKTAERYALAMIQFDKEDLKDFGEIIKKLKDALYECEICGHISDEKICSICSDESRNKELICVVEDFKSIFMFEKTEKFKGIYHVLGGLISPIDGVNPTDLNIKKLVDRCIKTPNTEVILALKPNIEGDTTTLYIKKVLEKYGVKVTRLSYGIPMGADIDYLDTLTLERALFDRKEIS